MADDKGAKPKPKDDNDDDKPLGPAGEKALEAEREARRKLEKEVAKLTAAATKAEEEKQAAEDSKKDELVKLQEKVSAMETATQKAEEERLRLDVIMETAPEGLPIAKARSLARRLAGSTREELLEDAAELLADFVPAKNGDGKEGEGDEAAGPFRGKARALPKEDLRSGNVGAGDDEGKKPDEIAKEILSAGF